jgi:uncharacterized repeat protein (TIGR01451 family)
MKKRITPILALAMTIGVLFAAPAQACACSTPALILNAGLDQTASSYRVPVGEPVTFTITKTNTLPDAQDWSVRDYLPTGVEFVSAVPSQGACAPEEGSNVVQCDLGVIPAGGSSTMDIVVTPTVPGLITNHAADTGENQASETITAE